MVALPTTTQQCLHASTQNFLLRAEKRVTGHKQAMAHCLPVADIKPVTWSSQGDVRGNHKLHEGKHATFQSHEGVSRLNASANENSTQVHSLERRKKKKKK